ncbi:putative peptidyl-prolyl cis-trans isomerase E [Biomphalaria pfeifferi]|uniref:Peptidyl-prolyl cis-trans isomerase E n=1 Tax=Biomphalaria pfeifferi TaxID=112525 RepID=A0AAD8AY92_BIOPF|nr:putative peptidyl-prolyl cis-trans isomerase E [Biomphalaria pfeifferi]
MSKNQCQKDPFKIYVRNLPDDWNENNLLTLCLPYGNIVNVEIPRDEDGHSLHHAYVTFESEDEASYAIFRLDKMVLSGREIRVKSSKLSQPHQIKSCKQSQQPPSETPNKSQQTSAESSNLSRQPNDASRKIRHEKAVRKHRR